MGIPYMPLKKLKKLKIDIVHTHHPLIIGQAASQIVERLKKPLFFTAHTRYEQYLNYYFPKGYDATSNILINDLVKISQKSKKVICPSLNTEKRLLKHGIKNTVIINNGVEDFFFNKPPKKPFKPLTLAYAGRLEREKNPFELIKIAKELKKIIPDFKFWILGSGLLLAKMQDQTLKLGLENNITFTGVVDRKLIPEIYKSVHLFITTSLSEVMPLSILEAMASGIPTLALKNSGLEEIVIDNKSGYICEKNPRKIAEKIAEIRKYKESYYNLSQKTYECALNFSAKNTARKLFYLYAKFKK